MDEIQIAEDLKDDYNDFANQHGGIAGIGWRKYARGLIERTSRAESTVAALQRDNATVTAAFAQQSQQWDVEAKELRDKCEALKSALLKVLPFVEDEHECREHSCLPEPTKDEEGYLAAAQDLVDTIREALGSIAARAAEQENGNGN